jgi:hypothetical protein
LSSLSNIRVGNPHSNAANKVKIYMLVENVTLPRKDMVSDEAGFVHWPQKHTSSSHCFAQRANIVVLFIFTLHKTIINIRMKKQKTIQTNLWLRSLPCLSKTRGRFLSALQSSKN